MRNPSIIKVYARRAAIGLLGIGLIATAYGQSTYFIEYSKTVAKVGAEGNFYYATFAESVGQNCQYGVLFIASDRKGLYTQLLAAKLSGKRISRLDYSQPDGNGKDCKIELVEIE